ncbi:MAG: PhzF family phenazine biosynthesis protein [Nitrososphaerales archaeon]
MIFHIVDVFAESKYAGNQLAVFRNAGNVSPDIMQKIARETNYSETTFITSKERNGASFDVRIFTPKHELPFAGHPTLGTAFVIQKFILKNNVRSLTLNLKVGPIKVNFEYDSKGSADILWMQQNNPKFGRRKFEASTFANILGIKEDEIDSRFPIQEVSTGLPFIIAPLRTLRSIRKCRLDRRAYFDLVRKTASKAILIFAPEPYIAGHDLSVRVFVEFYGPFEDPATGSGNGCLAAYISKHRFLGSSEVSVTVDQGFEIERPSVLYLKAMLADGQISVSVGGKVFPIAQGRFQ